MAIILFPDRLSDLRRHLRRAHEGRASSILVESFLRKAYGVLRDEAGILPRHARAQIPVFNSVFDLSERHHSSRYQRIEISAALTCACQLVHVIGYHLRLYLVLDSTDDYVQLLWRTRGSVSYGWS